MIPFTREFTLKVIKKIDQKLKSRIESCSYLNKLAYILDKSIVNKQGKPPIIKSLQQFLVWKFLKNPNETHWGREIKLANELIELCSTVDYWNFVSLPFKLNSLAWFKTDEGKEFLEKEGQRFRLVNALEAQEKGKVIPVEDLSQKGSTPVQIEQKPKTLWDFLKKR